MRAVTPFLWVRLTGGDSHVDGDPAHRLGQVKLPAALQTGQEIFGEWHWDGRQVTVRTCRFGFSPLFYYATTNEFGVSSSLEQLLACGAPAELDDAAVATFLRLGWLVGNETVFRGIRMVPPNGEVHWAGGMPEISGGVWFPRLQRMSRKTAVEGFGELFRQAMRRRASPEVPTGLPLSGGRDSRHILLELNALGCSPKACFTTHDFPPYREGNIRVAAMLCSRLGIPHQVIRQPASRLKAEVRKNHCTNFAALEGAWGMHFYDAISRSTSFVYDGLAGDSLSQSSFLKREHVDMLDRGDTNALAAQLVERWSWRTGEEGLARILTEAAARRFHRELAVERVAQELNLHATAANPLGSFNFWNRARRVAGLGPFAIEPQAGLMAMTPYLDHDLFEHLASLPADMLMEKTLHDETIHQMHPAFRDIPFSDTLGMPLVEKTWHYRRFMLEAAAYVAMNGTGELVRRGETARRLLALAVSEGPNMLRRAAGWIGPFHVVYLAQLEKILAAARTDAPG